MDPSVAPSERIRCFQACIGNDKDWSRDGCECGDALPPVRFKRYNPYIALGWLLLRLRFLEHCDHEQTAMKAPYPDQAVSIHLAWRQHPVSSR